MVDTIPYTETFTFSHIVSFLSFPASLSFLPWAVPRPFPKNLIHTSLSVRVPVAPYVWSHTHPTKLLICQKWIYKARQTKYANEERMLRLAHKNQVPNRSVSPIRPMFSL